VALLFLFSHSSESKRTPFSASGPTSLRDRYRHGMPLQQLLHEPRRQWGSSESTPLDPRTCVREQRVILVGANDLGCRHVIASLPFELMIGTESGPRWAAWAASRATIKWRSRVD
jgi:hypothetical protein